MRSWLVKTALFIASVTVAVGGLAELGLRLKHYGEANQTHDDKFTEYDPPLGWRLRPNSSGELRSDEYQTTIQYDSPLRLLKSEHARSERAGLERFQFGNDRFCVDTR